MMLSRLLLSSARAPTRAALARFSAASAPLWTRTLAHHQKPAKVDKKHSRTTGASEVAARTAGTSQKQDNDITSKHTEFDTSADPSVNTSPQFTSPSATGEPKDPQAQAPLPDLTHGIPSTIDFELSRASKHGRLNLTEAEDKGESGGRGRGELPASAYISSTEKQRLRLANYMYAGFAGLVVTGSLYLGRNWETPEDEEKHADAPSGWSPLLMWKRTKARLGDRIGHFTEPAFPKLLPDPNPMFERPYTLVLGLEDVLVHSEWTREHGWRVAKRPGLDYFLRYLSQYYEIVLWTPQSFGIADPLVRKLDPYHIITWPLYREATVYEKGECVKAS